MDKGENMYYVLNQAVITWRNTYLQAELVNYNMYVGRGKKRHYIPVPDTSPHWWEGIPLVEPLPLLKYKINNHAPLLDTYSTGTIFDLYSQRLIAILKQENIYFEVFPAVLIESKSDKNIEDIYSMFHLLDVMPAIDMKESDISPGNIKKIVLTRECIESKRLLFRAKERRNIVLIHEELKGRLDSVGITGFSYTPIGDYQVGLQVLADRLKHY